MMQQEGIPLGVNAEDASLNKAIEESLKVNTQGTYEPLDSESRARKGGEPIGFKNIGNTCYFNSLMQTLFRVEPFYRELVQLKDLEKLAIPEVETDINKKRYKEAILMVKALQEVFVTLTASNQKYTDPSNVLNRCVNDMAEHVKIGDQQDIVEYSVNFFERIEDVVKLVQSTSNPLTVR
jgi:ubiquitin carboxyl-terminal hydrolase 25